jgi:hypothetical protein
MPIIDEYLHEVRNNLDFEAAETYMQDHPEKTTPERLEEWSRNLKSRTTTLRPFLEHAWQANGEYCTDALDKTILIKKLSDVGGSLVLYPPHSQKEIQVHQIALLLRAEEKLEHLRTQALWKLNEAITIPEKEYPADLSLSHKLSLGD